MKELSKSTRTISCSDSCSAKSNAYIYNYMSGPFSDGFLVEDLSISIEVKAERVRLGPPLRLEFDRRRSG